MITKLLNTKFTSFINLKQSNDVKNKLILTRPYI